MSNRGEKKIEVLDFKIWVFNDHFNQIALKFFGQIGGLTYSLRLVFIKSV